MVQEDQFDTVLLNIAQHCEKGVPQMLDLVFGFLARKTDFYTGYVGGAEGGGPEKMVMDCFSKHEKRALLEEKKKAEEMAEKNRKYKEKLAKEKAQENRIVEVTDEEAKRFMDKDAAKKDEAAAGGAMAKKSKESAAGKKEDPEDDEGQGLQPNEGNGADLDLSLIHI